MGFLIRILFLIVLILLVLNLLKKARQQPTHTSNQQPGGAIQMAKCAECQVQFPLSEAVNKGPHQFCSTAHLQRWLGKE